MTRAETPKPKVLTADSTVTCSHTPFGTVVLQGAAKLRVRGFPVLVAANVGPAIGAGCTATRQGDVPCASILPPLTGQSRKLRSRGVPVVLSSLAASTNGVINAIPGALKVTAAQSKLVAP
jgi:hypothetical protein